MERTLIRIQQAAIDCIVLARANGPRAASYGMSLMNKCPRVLAKIRGEYIRQSKSLGFTEEQANAQWQDVRDMAQLAAHE